MIELQISNNDAGQRLNKYLMKYLNTAPSSFIYKMLRKKNIVLNDIKAKGDELLMSGDIVKLYLSDDTISKFRNNSKLSLYGETGNNIDYAKHRDIVPDNLVILYQDEDILAVHKPAGILSQKSKPMDYSINECIVDYCRERHILSSRDLETFTPSVCNRLDRNTSGIILAGISLKGSQTLSHMLRNRESDKYYFTIVKGNFVSKKHFTSYICKNSPDNISNVIDEDTYLKFHKEDKRFDRIETEFSPLSLSQGYTLLKIKLITGKSHQIRAHLKQLGYPIIGDTKYGDSSCNKYMREHFKLTHQLLHAGIVILPDGTHITDALPKKFADICKELKLSTKEIK